MAKVFLHTSEMMKNASDPACLSIKELLIASSWKYYHWPPSNLKYNDPPDPLQKEQVEENAGPWLSSKIYLIF